MAKTNFWKKLIAFSIIAIILIISGILVWKFWLEPKFYPGKGYENYNGTININETTIQYNYYKPGESNWTDALIVFIKWGLGALVLIVLIVFIYKLLKSKSITGIKSKLICEKAAREELIRQGYTIHPETPSRADYEYYGGDNEKHPRYAFGFLIIGTDNTTPLTSIPKYNWVTCKINAKTLIVTDPYQGKDWETVVDELKQQRYGKYGVPHDPVKTEREPGLFEFPGEKSISIQSNINDGGEG